MDQQTRMLSDHDWDITVIGGGITGAGVFRLATQCGYKACLIEQNDFASGTSSRSSKMVHGGLRYLKDGQLKLAKASVQERQALLAETGGLVKPLPFLMPLYQNHKPNRWVLKAGLTVYDLLAKRKAHRLYTPDETNFLAPGVKPQQMIGAMQYIDAVTDDARLVQRTLQESVNDGGRIKNYTKVTDIKRANKGFELSCKDEDNNTFSICSKVIVNATGSWASQTSANTPFKLRPLRGSHLVFEYWRLPVAQSITLYHPRDLRPVYIYPWEGVTLVGTTDLDHEGDLNHPVITDKEREYLLEAINWVFPTFAIGETDCMGSYAGIRPVIDTGETNPSKVPRDSLYHDDDGLITVTGGKLTTFREMAQKTLSMTKHYLPEAKCHSSQFFSRSDNAKNLPEILTARFGNKATQLTKESSAHEPLANSNYSLAECQWSLKHEQVKHLDDLMLRRTRLGLVLPQGGQHVLPILEPIVKNALSWSDNDWANEVNRYQHIIKTEYA